MIVQFRFRFSYQRYFFFFSQLLTLNKFVCLIICGYPISVYFFVVFNIFSFNSIDFILVFDSFFRMFFQETNSLIVFCLLDWFQCRVVSRFFSFQFIFVCVCELCSFQINSNLYKQLFWSIIRYNSHFSDFRDISRVVNIPLEKARLSLQR